jgi:sugar phosphate isomerase/epimerase
MMEQRSLSIAASFDYDLSIDAQLPLIAAAGFTHISLGGKEGHSGYLSANGRDRLKALLRRHALRIDTIHGPRGDQPGGVAALSAAVEAAADLGAPVVVAHGGPFDFPAAELPARLSTLLYVCAALEPLLARTGVALALENVLPGPATDLVRQALNHLDPAHFGFCYDSSHDQIGGPRQFDLLADLGRRLVAVHLSDRVADFVDHMLPAEGFIDWSAVAALLQQSPLVGPLLLEVAVTHSGEKEATRFLNLAYERGLWLLDQVSGR